MIWDAKTDALLHRFAQHRGAVTGVVFRRGTHELYSCSFDRTVKVFSVDQMAYAETLYVQRARTRGATLARALDARPDQLWPPGCCDEH